MSNTGDMAYSEDFSGQESSSWGFQVIATSVYLILSADGEITGTVGANSLVNVNIFERSIDIADDTGVSINLPYTVTTPGPFSIDFKQQTPLVPWQIRDPSAFDLQILVNIEGTGSVTVDPGFGIETSGP
jgi:hypothetical protein